MKIVAHKVTLVKRDFSKVHYYTYNVIVDGRCVRTNWQNTWRSASSAVRAGKKIEGVM